MDSQQHFLDLSALAHALPASSSSAEQDKVVASLSTLPPELKLQIAKEVATKIAKEEGGGDFFQDGADKGLRDAREVVKESSAFPSRSKALSDVVSLSRVNKAFYTACAPFTWQDVTLSQPEAFFASVPLVDPRFLMRCVKSFTVDYPPIRQTAVQDKLDHLTLSFPSLSSLSISISLYPQPVPFSSTITRLRLSVLEGDEPIASYLNLFSRTLKLLVLDNYDVPPIMTHKPLTLPELTHLGLTLGVNEGLTFSAFKDCPLTDFSITSCQPTHLLRLLELFRALTSTLRTFRYLEADLWAHSEDEADRACRDMALLVDWSVQNGVEATLPEVA